LVEADLSAVDLTVANLNRANLSGVDLNGAILSNAHLKEAELSYAYLGNSNLSGANISDASLKEADLSNSNANNADFSNADLSKINFVGADLRKSDFSKATLWRANLERAKLQGSNLSRTGLWKAVLKDADLSYANLKWADLIEADLSSAKLIETDLSGADLSQANLQDAKLIGTYLCNSRLVETKLENAELTGCWVYGISAWNLKGMPSKQSNLVITLPEEPTISVDNLEVAQFIYLLLTREKLRAVIDTITSKTVLILGRFTPERKVILDAMANRLRDFNLIPIIFDFERATSRDFTETIKTLAGLSLFVIADITNPKSAPLELQAVVPDYQIPFIPIQQKGEDLFSMFGDLQGKYDWVLKPLIYRSIDDLIEVLKPAIIDEGLKMHNQLVLKKAQKMETRSTDEYLNK